MSLDQKDAVECGPDAFDLAGNETVELPLVNLWMLALVQNEHILAAQWDSMP